MTKASIFKIFVFSACQHPNLDSDAQVSLRKLKVFLSQTLWRYLTEEGRVRIFEGLARSKLLGISQTKISHFYLKLFGEISRLESETPIWKSAKKGKTQCINSGKETVIHNM